MGRIKEMTTENMLLNILKGSLNNEIYKTEESFDLEKIASLAKTHGVLQCVAYYVSKLTDEQKPAENVREYLSQVLLQESMRSENQLYAVDCIQKQCEASGIDTLVVKGAVTKKRYSDPFLRSMSDIDVLYKTQQHNEFKKVMFALGYTDYREGRKNDTYNMPPFISVEAHRSLLANESEYFDYYSDVWNRCLLKNGCKHTYEMKIEDEFIFNIIHLAEHFKHGGVGIRFIMDVYVYDNLDIDRGYFENELKKLNLYDFYLNISALSEYWFANGESTELIEKLSSFVLSNEIFGTKENKAALYVSEGRVSGLLRTCFPEYEDMKSMYLWLDGRRYLLPYAWLHRAFKSLIYRRGNVKAQLSKAKNGDMDKGKELKAFYKECGLR